MSFSKRTAPLVLVILLVLPAWIGAAFGQANKTRQTSSHFPRDGADAELARMRADVIQKMRDSRARSRKADCIA